MRKKIQVVVDNEHIKKLTTSKNAFEPITELIWNSLDADSTEIKITIAKSQGLKSVESIDLVDNGHSMSIGDVENYFGKFGDNHKEKLKLSPSGRFFHGKKGYGRYKVLSICSKAIWTFAQAGQKGFTVKMSKGNPKTLDIDELSSSEIKCGTSVSLIDINDKFCNTLSDDAKVISKIASQFCVYLNSYKDVKISLNDVEVDIADYIISSYEDDFEYQINGIDENFHVYVIETKTKSDNDLYICNENGAILQPRTISYRPPFNFVCYILGNYFVKLSEATLLDTDLSVDLTEIVNNGVEFMKQLSRKRKAQTAKQLVDKLKDQKVYPYSEVSDPILQTEKDVFDIVVTEIDNNSSILRNMNIEAKRITLGLVKEVLSHNPSELFSLLREVFKLEESDLSKFIGLVEDISLSRVINMAATINDRFKTLEAFRLFIGDTDLKAKVKERAQLHKLLVENLWILGDHYLYGTDDQSLKNLLIKHLSILGRESNDIDFGAITGLETIPDIFIYQQYPDNNRPSRYKNLIIEIKRPSNKAGTTELNQIKSYAKAVINEPLYDKTKTYWEFILLATECKQDIHDEINQKDRDKGIAIETDQYRVKVLLWSELLQNCQGRLDFLKKSLHRSYNKEEVISYLKKSYSYFSTL